MQVFISDLMGVAVAWRNDKGVLGVTRSHRQSLLRLAESAYDHSCFIVDDAWRIYFLVLKLGFLLVCLGKLAASEVVERAL